MLGPDLMRMSYSMQCFAAELKGAQVPNAQKLANPYQAVFWQAKQSTSTVHPPFALPYNCWHRHLFHSAHSGSWAPAYDGQNESASLLSGPRHVGPLPRQRANFHSQTQRHPRQEVRSDHAVDR